MAVDQRWHDLATVD